MIRSDFWNDHAPMEIVKQNHCGKVLWRIVAFLWRIVNTQNDISGTNSGLPVFTLRGYVFNTATTMRCENRVNLIASW